MIVEIKYRTTTYMADVFQYKGNDFPFIVNNNWSKYGLSIEEYIESCKQEYIGIPKEQVLLLCKHVPHHECPENWSEESWERSLRDGRNLWAAKVVDKK